MPKVVFQDLGLIDYKEAWDYQEKRFNEILDVKKNNRKENRKDPTLSYLLFCEHPHVYTLGKSGDENNLLVNEDYLKSRGATFYKINRGGDITYHGPGQIVGYPILDLDNFFTDIHKYLRYLEEAVILTLADYGIESTRSDGETGVWLDVGNENARKICALGVRSSRWVTMHGFAFNVNCDLSYFGNIIPCGIVDKSVTSMQKELGKEVDMQEVQHKLKDHLKKLFDFQFVNE
ncbi:MAG: lipoyl(octanoyl) transferase LipB [Flavobacteriales bacterium]|nr:lipoyl(octanoyl) transferase LipB [Flavobacteriales bacterium]